MSNMRELYLCDSVELTEVPGLGKSLNSMTRIHMEGCTNLTSEFRKNILQGWTSSGYGGIYLNGIYDIPEWFEFDDDVDNIVFEVPQRIMGRDLKGLTVCFVYSSDSPVLDSVCIIGQLSNDVLRLQAGDQVSIFVRPDDVEFTLPIFYDMEATDVRNQTVLHTRIALGSVKTSSKPEDDYLWQGQLSNDVLRLQGDDQVSILVRPDDVDFVTVKKTGSSRMGQSHEGKYG
ncbi:hypothetical protein L3X38_000094 [Prunus dulcis]|uniref:Disease resistance protein TIR-NBS-LRR class family n=1 Tax=Prunus dulcis TaxID=3755 RepID=A0AAD4UPX8_PRUDU|nr:hypothetical protein L3X38_000094 [Prunus dulcis]